MLQLDLSFRRGSFALRARATLGAKVTGICGPSGAGKSTLLALLAGLLHPQQGSIRFDTQLLDDVERGIRVPPWRRHFGLVFQEDCLFPHLSVRGNLLYGLRRLPAAARRLNLETVQRLLELEPLLGRRPTELSGGERQRVALGRALLYSPRLLLLDEPLTALDPRLKQQILPFLQRIKQEVHIPMVYVSHDREELEFLADERLEIADGELRGARADAA